MKVTFKNGTVVEDVLPEELPAVLAMSDPMVVVKRLIQPVTDVVIEAIPLLPTLLPGLNQIFDWGGDLKDEGKK